MARLCETENLTDVQTEILKTIRDFVDNEILPVATSLEHADEYPTDIVEGMKDLGLFGLGAVPLGLDHDWHVGAAALHDLFVRAQVGAPTVAGQADQAGAFAARGFWP